ncbi:MAG: hypothetical protein U0939_21430 [Pirellulales bacterium]
MARFYLIDNSLKSEGGHHFDYDRNVLIAAERQGWEPILASHRRFRMRHRLPPQWKVRYLFPHSTYSRYSYMYGSAAAPLLLDAPEADGPAKSWIGRLTRRWRRWRAAAECRTFASACRRLFDEFPAQRGDIVFFPTMSDLDLAGLAEFLRHAPATLDPDWHFQFHRSYPVSERSGGAARGLELMRQFLQQLSPAWEGRRLYGHATTVQLAQRFQALQGWPVDQLNHAVDVEVLSRRRRRESPETKSQRPLRVLLAGGSRPEKGSSQLARLVDLYQSQSTTQRPVQVWVQAKRPQRLGIPRLHVATLEELRGDALPTSPRVIALPHPLGVEDYMALFEKVDAGLCLHDPREYQERCSGVLVELLAAGLPVLVPDACWLAEETATAGQPWAEALWQRCAANDDARTHSLRFQLDGPHSVASQTVSAPAAAQRLLLRYRRLPEHTAQGWLRVSLEPAGEPGRSWVSYIPSGPEGSPWTLVAPWRFHREAVRIQVSVIGASASRLEAPLELSWDFEAGPTGAVGLTADGVEQFAQRLRELVDHFEHFQATALQHGMTYALSHHPSRVIDRLQQLQTV